MDRESKRASQHLLLQEHDNSVLEGTHTLTHKPSKRQKYSAIMSGDMNWDEEKSQDLTNPISMVRPNVPATGLRAGGSEHRTQHIATYWKKKKKEVNFNYN